MATLKWLLVVLRPDPDHIVAEETRNGKEVSYRTYCNQTFSTRDYPKGVLRIFRSRFKFGGTHCLDCVENYERAQHGKPIPEWTKSAT